MSVLSQEQVEAIREHAKLEFRLVAPGSCGKQREAACKYIAELADTATALQADNERLTDIIRKESWLADASLKDIPGPYVPWDTHTKEIADLTAQLAASEARVQRLKTMGTVEMMCENENIDSHVREWEARCLKAEAENERLRQQHANVLKNVSSEWETQREANEVTCHSRMVGGVLCRWWGDGPVPSGVAVIDAQADLTAQLAASDANVTKLKKSLNKLVRTHNNLKDEYEHHRYPNGRFPSS